MPSVAVSNNGMLVQFTTASHLNDTLANAPLVVLTNSAAEYWRGDASLAHIEAGFDLPEPPGTRSYLFASTQHGAAPSAESTMDPQVRRSKGARSKVAQCAPADTSLRRARAC